MVTIDRLNIDAYRVNDLALSWSYPSTQTVSGFTIDVYRSEAPIEDTLTGYTLIASGLSADTIAYIDTTVSGYFHHNRDWYYKLKFVEALTSTVVPASPSYLNQERSLDRVYIEILRRKAIGLSKSERTFNLLKRRTVGTRCTTCWDPVSMRVTEADCDECYGTGWTNGYFNPIEFTAMTNDSPKFNEITMFGEFMPSDCILLVLSFPLFKIKDMVADDNNDRWIVQDVRATRKKNKVIEQRVHLALIAEDDPLYKIQI